MRLADLFVLPSVTMPTGKEPWGLVVNEAMNQGLPVIATEAVGAAAGGLVQPGVNGFIVPERDSEALAQAMRRILGDENLRRQMSHNARQIVTGWDNQRMVKGFEEAIDYAVRRNGRSRGGKKSVPPYESNSQVYCRKAQALSCKFAKGIIAMSRPELVHGTTSGPGVMRLLARRLIPRSTRQWLWAKSKAIACKPPVGLVRFGGLRRLAPISRQFGLDRGTPVDRYYIERFLSAHASDIQGRVLEIGDDTYTRRFGGERVTQYDVLHVESSNPNATIIGDLTDGKHISSDIFDCIILTQTLQFIYDVRAAINTLHRILKPGGVVLITTSGISQISRYDMDRYGHFWNFTSLSIRRLLEGVFLPRHVQITTHGNVLAAMAFLHGLSAQELRQKELDYTDADYELVINIRAVKSDRKQ